MKNHATAGAMNMHGESDSKLRPIVDPHDVTGLHTLEECTEDITYNPLGE